jgi:hypothetical protein
MKLIRRCRRGHPRKGCVWKLEAKHFSFKTEVIICWINTWLQLEYVPVLVLAQTEGRRRRRSLCNADKSAGVQKRAIW